MNSNGLDLSILTNPATTFAASRAVGTILAPFIIPKQIGAQQDVIKEAIRNGTLRQKNLLDTMEHLSDNGDLSPELKAVFATLLLQLNQVL